MFRYLLILILICSCQSVGWAQTLDSAHISIKKAQSGARGYDLFNIEIYNGCDTVIAILHSRLIWLYNAGDMPIALVPARVDHDNDIFTLSHLVRDSVFEEIRLISRDAEPILPHRSIRFSILVPAPLTSGRRLEIDYVLIPGFSYDEFVKVKDKYRTTWFSKLKRVKKEISLPQ